MIMHADNNVWPNVLRLQHTLVLEKHLNALPATVEECLTAAICMCASKCNMKTFIN